jgi:hypothetical protein
MKLNLPTRMVLCKDKPITFTSLGGQFDDCNTRQLDTNISTPEVDNEEIDLESVEILSEGCLSSLMRKHDEDVWDFMDAKKV